jgi:UDP-N-acetylmuramate--alanine ligase
MSGPGRLWAVWQPHTYTRLRALSESFKDAFLFADQVLVTEVYSVRENAGPGLGAKEMAKLIQESGPQTRYSGDLNMTAQILADEVQAGDVVVVMSAGDAPRINQMLLAVLQKRATP